MPSSPFAADAPLDRGTAGRAATESNSHGSAVSWGAILAGAAAAAALSLILLLLGTGLGFSSVSPWADRGASATVFGISTILWLTLTQLLASGMGGYLAGRLRTKWVGAHTDEVYFRDTAHGFLAWAVASLATAALLTSAIGAIVGGGVQAGASMAGGATSVLTTGAAAAGVKAAGDQGGEPMGYFVDSLFRRDASGAAAPAAAAPAAASASEPAVADPAAAAASAPTSATPSAPSASSDASSGNGGSAEVARIFLNSIRSGALPAEDLKYVAGLVAPRAGIAPADAEKRVTETYARAQAKLREAETAARDAADKARKASAYAALWLFISMLIGAFVASLAATYGGRQRDF